MRFLGVDCGAKRVGLALSDATGLLARAWQTLPAGPTPEATARTIAQALAAGRHPLETDPLVDAVVIGLPRRLSGEETHETGRARALAAAIAGLTGLPVHLQDERLSSHEADARLARSEPDWRARKSRLDAEAASVILQDYLDSRSRDEVRPPA